MGHLASRRARYQEALQQAQQAEGLYRLADHQAGQAGALNNMGWYQMQLGNTNLALDCCQRSLAKFEDMGNQHCAATSLASLGALHHRLGDSARGIEFCTESLRCFQEHGDLPSQAEILSQLGEMHETYTDVRSAHECWQRAAAIYTQLDHPDATILHGRLRDFRHSP
jgi:tetratricopeptide (TPR) repeat protein